MEKIINKHEFELTDEKFIDFFAEHGWVVINNVLSKNEIKLLQAQYKKMKKEYANDAGIDLKDYEREITQWRDLWLREGVFKKIIFDEKGINCLVKKSMGWVGVKLLHDHIVSKPPETTTSIVPWHQDSMFWPVDRVGCSALTALKDVKVESGCLEVIDSSHLNGCEKPQDFMATEKNDFLKDSVCVSLPIKAGSTILMHSLCWHRSSANRTLKDRALHLSLWIHTNANWSPDLVNWHPINKHVKSKPNKELRGSMFPSFGINKKITKPSEKIHSGMKPKEEGISMFNASSKIGTQIFELLDIKDKGSLVEILGEEEKKQKIINEIIKRNICNDKKVLNQLLYSLWICISSYEKNDSRNIFNTAYDQWWKIVGEKLEMLGGKNSD